MRFNGVYIRDLGRSPAAVSRRTGELYLNHSFFKLPYEQQVFILAHEWSHYILDTRSELKADENAFYKYALAGLPLSQAVLALYEVLDMNNPAHVYRTNRVFEHALYFDYFINPSRQKLKTQESRMDAIKQAFDAKNAQMHKLLQLGRFDEAQAVAVELFNMMPEENQAEFWQQMQSLFADYHIQLYSGADLEQYEGEYTNDELEYSGDDICNGGNCDEDGYDDNLEYTNGRVVSEEERKRRNQERYDNRQYKKTSRTDRDNERVFSTADKKRMTGEAKLTKAQAQMELAKQGISAGAEAAKAFGGAAQSIAGIFGGKKSQEVPADGEQPAGMSDPNATQQPAPEGKKMKWWVWLIIAIVAIAAIVGVVMLLRKKKKAA